jgi:hypothetical protein
MSIQTWFTIIAFNALVLALPIAAIILWRKPELWLHLWTLFVGVLVGLMDAPGRATEVQMTVLLLLAFQLHRDGRRANPVSRGATVRGVYRADSRVPGNVCGCGSEKIVGAGAGKQSVVIN